MTIEQIRLAVREELLGKGQIDLEFREIVAVEGGDSFLPCEDSAQEEMYTASEELEKLTRGEPLSLMNASGIESATWDEDITFEKSTRATRTLAQKLGVVKTELFEQDGERFVKAFDADGEVVAVRVLLDVA